MINFNYLRLSVMAFFILSPISAVTAELEEIVVTGSKRVGTVMTTPGAITAVSSEELSARGIDEVSELQFAVPSLHFGEVLGNKRITIRGVGEFNNQPGVMVSVGGVVQSSGTSSQLSQLDLDRVEVMRGPQGTLYGRNSNGGAVNFIPAKPTDEVIGRVKMGYAEYDHISLEGVYSAPISDNIGVRLAFNHLDAGEGWVENLVEGSNDHQMGEKTNVRLTVSAEISDSLTADVVFARSEMNGAWDHWAISTKHMEIAGGSPAEGGGGLPLEYQGTPVLVTDAPWKIYNNGISDSERQYDLMSLTIDKSFDGFSLKSITAYQDWDDLFGGPADASSIGLFSRSDHRGAKTFTQEFNLSGKTGNWDWVAGAYYMDDQRDRTFLIFLPIPAFFPFPIQFEHLQPQWDTKATAFFVDATYALSDSWRVGMGVRSSSEDIDEKHSRKIFQTTEGVPAADPFLDFCGGYKETSWTESDTTLRASMEVDTSDDSMIYGSYSEGFKAGGINIDCQPPWKPETVSAYELGYKSILGDGTTSISAALFHYAYDDFQVAQVIGISGIIANAGDTSIDGVEVEFVSNINDSLNVSAGYTYLDSSYGDFLNQDSLQPNAGAINVKGNRLNNAPEHSLNLGATYNIALSGGGSLALSLNNSYRSRTFFREFNALADSQASYVVVNADANYISADGLYGARFFIRNATNAAYVTGMATGNTQYGRHAHWGMPRQMGIEVTRHFGGQ
jgi:iron complex outermembrane receptor protein